MVILGLNNIKKSYGLSKVLNGFSLTVNKGERIGLIGPNGSGKTTIFKIINGKEIFSEGKFSISKNTSIGYLSQIPDFEVNSTIYHELEDVFSNIINLQKKMKIFEKRMSNDNEPVEELINEYSELQHEFEMKGGYSYKSQIEKVAYGLGFTEKELYKKPEILSGGEKTRLGLSKLLLKKPNILLLDEPTNHLDLSSIKWLEDYLQDYSGTVILVSHDRYFLDRVVERIVEIKHGENEDYAGNYSFYLKERQKRFELKMNEYKNQQKKIKKIEESIKRLYRWGKQGDNEKFFKQAQNMQKRLDRMEEIKKPSLGGEKMKLELDIERRSGREVIMIDNLQKSYDNKEILKGVELKLYWGEKAGIIGKNGSGKTTILKGIIGNEKFDAGNIKIGANVRIGYYSQEFKGFNKDDDLITALRREVPMSEGDARNLLASFLFREDEVFKKIKELSGGEKSRLRLLQLMNGEYNLLVLDEPTNHLDLPSREVLEEAMMNYSGTILVVSHDRYFLNKFVDYIFELENGKLSKFHGDYDYYLIKKDEFKINENKIEKKELKNDKSEYHRLKKIEKEKRKKKKKINSLEEEIMILEKKKEELENEMLNPDNLDDYNILREIESEYSSLQEKLSLLYQKWELIVEG